MKFTTQLAFLLALGCAITSACGKADGQILCDEVEGRICYDCYGPVVRCTFEGVEVTERSCEGCQARVALYLKLCEMGSTATVEEVEAGMVCEEVDTGER